MLARTKKLTNLMVLISTIQKIHCTETPLPLIFYSFFGTYIVRALQLPKSQQCFNFVKYVTSLLQYVNLFCDNVTL